MNVNALQPNSETGFLESPSSNNLTVHRNPFNSARKVTFLELANAFADREEAPNLGNICKQIGIGLQTFYDHLDCDPEFKRAYEEVQLKIEDALQRSLIRSGVKGAQGTTAAIFWLKNRFNKRWNDGVNQISLDSGQLKNIIGGTGFIDAEIVPKPGIISTPKAIEQPGDLK